MGVRFNATKVHHLLYGIECLGEISYVFSAARRDLLLTEERSSSAAATVVSSILGILTLLALIEFVEIMC